MPEALANVLATVLVIIHAGYLIYLVTGGFVAWIRTAACWPHAVAVVWALAVVSFSIDCPLTTWENQLRVAAGESPYHSSFIEHHVAGLLYPEGFTLLAELVAALLVLVSWIPLAARARSWSMRHHGSRTHPIRAGASRDDPSERARFR